MFEEFETILSNDDGAKIKIIGVGGGGNNAVNKMAEDRINGVEFIVANTDNQVLKDSNISKKLLLGASVAKGLGAGALPDVGRKAAEESIDDINAIVANTDLVFIAAGLGGGTGTGAAPIIAKAAKDAGALVISIVTTPFNFEGKRRTNNSIDGLRELTENSDSVIIVSNDRLLDELGEIPLTDSFKYSDAILKQAVRTIADLITEHSLINLDFADIKTVIKDQGPALIGVGVSSSENAAVEAAIDAINSPILESSINGARNAIISITGSSKSLTIKKAEEAVDTIKEAASNDIDIMFGISINEELGDEIIVSVIATGLNNTKESVARSETLNADQTTDIEKYKDLTITREFNPNIIMEKEIVAESLVQDDIFDSLSILDDDSEEISIEELLRED
jgi:cell division protein FtsZ